MTGAEADLPAHKGIAFPRRNRNRPVETVQLLPILHKTYPSSFADGTDRTNLPFRDGIRFMLRKETIWPFGLDKRRTQHEDRTAEERLCRL